jgi:hypothetical protein
MRERVLSPRLHTHPHVYLMMMHMRTWLRKGPSLEKPESPAPLLRRRATYLDEFFMIV